MSEIKSSWGKSNQDEIKNVTVEEFAQYLKKNRHQNAFPASGSSLIDLLRWFYTEGSWVRDENNKNPSLNKTTKMKNYKYLEDKNLDWNKSYAKQLDFSVDETLVYLCEADVISEDDLYKKFAPQGRIGTAAAAFDIQMNR